MYISEAFVHSTICREMSVTLSFADNVLCLVHMYCMYCIWLINEIPNNPGFLQIKTAAYTANQTHIYHRGMNNVSEKMGFNI